MKKIYELELKKDEWDNSEILYIYGNDVFMLQKENLEKISLTGTHSWNFRKGNVYLRELKGQEYDDVLDSLKKMN